MSQVVTKGQVWEDKDKRRIGRTFRVEDVVNNQAICKSLGGTRPKFTKIRVDRFVPKYYVLKTDGTKTGSATTNPPKLSSVSWKVTPRMVGGKVKASDGPNGLSVRFNPAPVTSSSSLLSACQAKLPCTWSEVVPNVAEAVSGPFKLVVRNFRDKSYDIKVMLDGIIVDTWVAHHLDINTVLDHLRDKVKSMRDGLGSLLD